MYVRIALIFYMLTVGVFFSSASYAVGYTFTPIATTHTTFSGFANAAINDSGVAAFWGSLKDGGEGIFIWNSGTISTVADTSSQYSALDYTPIINNSGTVAFSGYTNSGNNGIYTWSSGNIDTVYDDTGIFSSLGSPDINNSGTVAFVANLDAGGTSIVSGNGGATTTIADSGSFHSFRGKPSINDSGVVVFVAYRSDFTDPGVFSGDGETITTVSDNLGQFDNFSDNASINNNNAVSFQAFLDTGDRGIFTVTNGTVQTISDSSGPLSGYLDPTINDLGMVAFSGAFDAEGGGIFAGTDSALDNVIQIGDTLEGLSVTGISFGESGGNHGLNNAGQVAFWAQLSDGSVGLYLASPIPIPPALWLFGSGLLGMAIVAKQRYIAKS